jgi:hypothetical protein
MPSHDNLALHEEVLLLAMGEKGTTAIESHLNLAIEVVGAATKEAVEAAKAAAAMVAVGAATGV